MSSGAIHSVETFGSVDGPGVRYVIFLQGCAMRCQYCHNADTWKGKSPDTGALDVLKKALRYRPYWKDTGGITVSGGEPLLQMDFVTELFQLAKAQSVHTALDTAGQPFVQEGEWFEKFQALMEVTDLVLLDLKHIHPDKHKALAGWDNANILAMARYLADIKKPVWIRHVLVPGITDREEDLAALYDFIKDMDNIQRVEVLPYHPLGAYKWEQEGMEYPLKDVLSPDDAALKRANALLHTDTFGK